MRWARLDQSTADTLARMIRYIPDDGKIARYLHITEHLVRVARINGGRS